MIGALAAAALAAGGCVDGLCNPNALAPWFARLARARSGGSGARPLHLLQIGDSHSAGDAITGAWREMLQQRYGAGGRGVLPPGRPYDGYTTRGVTVTMSPGWSISADFGKGWGDGHAPLGLSGFSLTSVDAGSSMSLVADPAQAFSRLVVCAIARPDAGSLTVRMGIVEQQVELGASIEHPTCRTFHVTTPVTTASLTTGGGAVTVTSWGSFADGPGVALSNLGVVGSQLVHFARTDDAVVGEELRAYAPDLIVIAFGTNEGFSPRFSPFEYEIILRTQIGRIRRLAGNVPILLLGAPDALTRRSDLLANAGGPPSAVCGDAPAPAAADAPAATPPPSALANAMAKLGYTLGLTDAPAPAAPSPPVVAARGGLFPPQALEVVRSVQQRVATSLNVGFWDWAGRMGGRCTARTWARAQPPLMRGDYVHYTSAGGREIAARLQADLDRANAR